MQITSFKNINFGKKIPINSCKILDKTKGKYIDATVYEYDCKDLNDVYEVKKLDNSWSFKDLFVSGMHEKFITNMIKQPDNDNHYYSIEDENQKIVGLCHTKENENEINVKLLASQSGGKYKYVGQNMLSAMAQKILKTNKEIFRITGVLKDVSGFYEKTCGFEEGDRCKYIPCYEYHLSKENLEGFIENVSAKTQNNQIPLG